MSNLEQGKTKSCLIHLIEVHGPDESCQARYFTSIDDVEYDHKCDAQVDRRQAVKALLEKVYKSSMHVEWDKSDITVVSQEEYGNSLYWDAKYSAVMH